MKRKSRLIFFLLAIAAVVISFILIKILFKKIPDSSSNKLSIAASIYPVYFLASEIGGNKVFTYNITPAGVEPHDFEPTSKDMVTISSSKLLILNGGVETWGFKIQDSLQNKGVPIVTAGKGLIVQNDPHIWLSPQMFLLEAERIGKALEDIDIQNADYYRTNQEALAIKLNTLDQKYLAELKNCQSKYIITSHAAFGYMAKQYGLTEVPIAGLTPDAEPSIKQLVDITKFAKDNNIKYIFYETLGSPKLAQTIAREIGGQILPLDPIEGLSNNKIAEGADYFSIMEDNLKNLQTALRCTK